MTGAYERFDGVTNWRQDDFSQNLLHGVIDWAKWAMLQVGGFQNVSMTQASGILGGHPSILHCVQDPNYTQGKVWESERPDWVWETNVDYGTQPVVASGVSVNATFYPTATTTGAYEHYIDYPSGRIVFTTAISTTAKVKTNYSYRAVSFVDFNQPWAQEILFNSFSDDIPPDKLSKIRRRMPFVAVEIVDRRRFVPYEVGSGGQWVMQDVLFHICTENPFDRDQILDILTKQNDKVIWIPDRGKMKLDGKFPYDLDYRGSRITSPMQYPEIISLYPWMEVQFKNTTTQTMKTVNQWLYRAVIRTTFTGVLENM